MVTQLIFFISAWDVVGSLFVAAVKEFFISASLLKQMSATAIALLPKVPKTTKVTDYRPIACCNNENDKIQSPFSYDVQSIIQCS